VVVVVVVRMRQDEGMGVAVAVTVIEAEKYLCHPLASASCYQKCALLFSAWCCPHSLVKANHHHVYCLKHHPFEETSQLLEQQY